MASTGVLIHADELEQNPTTTKLKSENSKTTERSAISTVDQLKQELWNVCIWNGSAPTTNPNGRVATQSKLDELRSKINALPDGQDKQALLQRLAEIQNKLSEIQIKSSNGQVVVQINAVKNDQTTNAQIFIRTFKSHIEGNAGEF
ncbi:hypothetical protein LOS20_16130 [Enterococcus faecium]|nr:hypothetical protein [Enterococcus faecium]